MKPDISDWSAVLDSVKNPMIFSALVILAALLALLGVAYAPQALLPEIFRMWFCGGALGLIAAIAGTVLYFSRTDPRFLTYGPKEYLRESELEVEKTFSGASLQSPGSSDR